MKEGKPLGVDENVEEMFIIMLQKFVTLKY